MNYMKKLLPLLMLALMQTVMAEPVPASLESGSSVSNDQFNSLISQIKAKKQVRSAPVRSAQAMPKKPVLPPTYEEGQKMMLDTVPESAPPSELSEKAFRAMLQENMPMTPDQVVRLRQQLDKSQRASSITANIPPKSVSSTLMINLAPGATPPAVRLSQGYVSSLVFVDSTGTPWPIESFDIGNPKTVNIQWDGKTNILLIQLFLPISAAI